MGNIVHCCRILSGYFRCRDALTQNEPERSALLLSDDSNCDQASLSENCEEDLSTISTGVTNRTLEPENLLFPDIILSSSLGGDVTLVEPMVCLLVSEEGEAMRLAEDGRVFSEVETQTEVETWIGSQAQTQTEMVDSRAASEDLGWRDAETPGGGADAAAWSGEVNRTNKGRNGHNIKGGVIHKVQILNTTDHTIQAEQSTELHGNREELHTLPSRIEGCGDNSQHPSAMLTEHMMNLDHFMCVDETGLRGQSGKQAGQGSDQKHTGTQPQAKENVRQTVDEWIIFSQHQDNWQQLAIEEEKKKVDVPVQAERGDCVKGGVCVFAHAVQSHFAD